MRAPLQPLRMLGRARTVRQRLKHADGSVNKMCSSQLVSVSLLLCNSAVVSRRKLVLPRPLVIRHQFMVRPLTRVTPSIVRPILRGAVGRLFASSFSPRWARTSEQYVLLILRVSGTTLWVTYTSTYG